MISKIERSKTNKPNSWKRENNQLKRLVKMKDFNQVIDLVNKIAEIAEEMDHHPDLRLFSYNNLEICVYTHESGEITDKDIRLAEKIEELL